jgi:hypothetical protein
MGTNSAGKVGGGNGGQTDLGRGTLIKFAYTKSGRRTGQIGGGIKKGSNDLSPDATKRTANDPRLA